MSDFLEIPVRCAHREMVDPVALVPHPRNPNTHPEAQIAVLARVIKAQGWRSPIVISNRSGYIVAGHGRLDAAKLLKLDKVPVDRQDFKTEADEIAHLLADNRIAELAEMDDTALSDALKELERLGGDLDLTGFNLDDLASFGIGGTEGESDNDGVEAISKAHELQKKWKVNPGDIWRLGEHLIACGDSSDAKLVGRLFGKDRATLVWTDPPYGVDYSSKNEMLNKVFKGHRIQTPIENDALDPKQLLELAAGSLAVAAEFAEPGCSLYVACPAGPLHAVFQDAIGKAGFTWKHTLVWVKNNHVLGRSDYHYRHEPILYGWKEDGPHKWNGDRSQTSVFEVDKPQSSELHPTMKPVELVERMVRNSSVEGDIVFDPFSGSGTTLVACEQTKRRCRAVEKNPSYVSVTIERWFQLTNGKPERL